MPSRMRKYGAQTMIGKLRKVLVKKPMEGSQEVKRWKSFSYDYKPSPRRTKREYNDFLDVLKDEVDEIIFVKPQKAKLDSVFIRDTALVVDRGAILGRMGKEIRKGEERSVAREFERQRIRIVGRIRYPGTLEAGDLVWIDPETVAVGVAYRTNNYGFHQLKDVLKRIADAFPVHLPHWEGPSWGVHLSNLISMVDKQLALAHSRLLPVTFLEFLNEKGVEIIEVDKKEFDGLAPNILALEPGRIIMLAGYPKTRGRLTRAGVEVTTIQARDLCLNRGQGPNGLVLPVLRNY